MSIVNGLDYFSQTASPDLELQKTDKKVPWTERAVANIKFNYQNQINYMFHRPIYDENFDLTYDMIPDDLKQYAVALSDAESAAHLDNKISMIRKGLDTRAARNQTGFFESLAYEFLDPINIVALPFGGPSFGIGKSALRVGAGVTALIGAKEATRYAVDPLATPEEVALEVGSAAVFGSLFGGLLGVSPTLRAKATAKAVKEHKTVLQALDGLTPDDIELLGAREARAFGKASTKTLRTDLSLAKKRNDNTRVTEINQEIALRELEGYKDKDQNSIYKEDNFFVRGVSNPYKRFLKTPLQTTKKYMHQLAGDSGLLTVGNLAGEITGSSVYVKAKVRRGQVYKTQVEMALLWADDVGGATTFAGYNPTNFKARINKTIGREGKSTLEDWMSGVSKKRILEDFDNMTPNEKKASDMLDDYFNKYEVELRENGLIGSSRHYTDSIKKDEDLIAAHETKIKTLRDKRALEKAKRTIARLRERVTESKKLLDDAFKNPNKPTNETHFFARYFDAEAIKKDRTGFTEKIIAHFKANPHPRKTNTEQAIKLRAEETVKKILNERHDPINPEKIFIGAGSAKHTISRTLDIPNKDVVDYLVTDPMDVMYEYDRRMAPALEFNKMYGNKNIEDILDEIELDGIAQGMSQRKINAALKDFRHMYDRIVGVVKKDPSKFSHKIGYFLSELASTSYLGSAGLATISEPAKMLMTNELSTVFRSLIGMLDRFDNTTSVGMKETMLAGEGWEVRAGGAQRRLMEEMMSNNKYAKVWNKSKNAFYTLNGLTPMTVFLKNWESLNRQHSIIDRSIRWSQGKKAKKPITAEERTFLVGYNIDFKTAQKIAKAPWQKSKAGQYIANTEAWVKATEFPDVAEGVNIVSERGSGKFDKQGRYVAAYYNPDDSTIYIDEEYLTETFKKNPWLSPRQKGVNPLPSDMFKTPQDWIDFVKMHEILHTTNRPEKFGFKTYDIVKTKNVELTNKDIINRYGNKLDEETDAYSRFFVDNDEYLEAIEINNFRKDVFTGILEGKIKTSKDITKLKSWNKIKNKDDFVEMSDTKVIDEDFKKDFVNESNDLIDSDWLKELEIANRPTLEGIQEGGPYPDRFDIYGFPQIDLVRKIVNDIGNGRRRNNVNVDDYFNKEILEELMDAEVLDFQKRFAPKKFNKEYITQLEGFQNNLITENEFKSNFLDILFKHGEDYNNNTVNILLNKHVDMKTVHQQNAPIYRDINADLYFSKMKLEVDDFSNRTPKQFNEDRVKNPKEIAKYENKINELAMEKINAQNKIDESTVDTFREAMSNGILNTVLMGTPADRPIVMDNVMYVPMSVARFHPFLKEDPKFKGYARIENGMLARPLQFYSYLMAAVTKISGSMAQNGATKNRALVMSAFMGLGYLQYRIRVPEYIREKDNWPTALSRSLDYSGLGNVYSDVLYTSMHTAMALGMDNPTQFGRDEPLIAAKYNQKKNYGEALTGIMGAGPSIGYDIAMGFKDMVQGDVGKGGAKVMSNLPYMRTIWWKKEMKELARAFARNY